MYKTGTQPNLTGKVWVFYRRQGRRALVSAGSAGIRQTILQKVTKETKTPFSSFEGHTLFSLLSPVRRLFQRAAAATDAKRRPGFQTNTPAACAPRDYFSATGCLASSTSFSKRGSPRSGSHHGISFNSP